MNYNHITTKVVVFLQLFALAVECGLTSESVFESFGSKPSRNGGTKWAVLIAGSNGYYNYRHQADVCHAYQILKKGGLKDENIVVFMYDDIARNPLNCFPGVMKNNPNGENVYLGVQKDYTGENVTPRNILAVITGNRTSTNGGSGKVVNSGPDDDVLIFFSGHGGPGVLGMPGFFELLYADDIIGALKTKHTLQTYGRLVFYLESCESGSIFDGLLPKDMNIYAVTAAKPDEDSYATYYSRVFGTYLGDLFSISWMEDSQQADRKTETLEQQYQVVKNRTESGGYIGSHPKQYGTISLSSNFLDTYMGSAVNSAAVHVKSAPKAVSSMHIAQRDAELLYLKKKWRRAPNSSHEKEEARKKLEEVISHRYHIDNSMKAIGELLFGAENGAKMLNFVRPAGYPLVDDWECLRNMVGIYRTRCGSLATYGLKHMRGFANICNAGIHQEQMVKVSAQACS
ncbi:hypothetical protein Drorol1_Dr00000941 [Drosera rotundifolia]